MPLFTTYDINGQPISRIKAPLEEAEIILEGVSYIVGWLAEDEYVKEGQVTQMPPKPSPSARFNYESEVWEEGLSSSIKMQRLRGVRNQLLKGTDWTQLSDVPPATQLTYINYRQALRDVTLQEGAPDDVIWPTPPES